MDIFVSIRKDLDEFLNKYNEGNTWCVHGVVIQEGNMASLLRHCADEIERSL